MTDFSKIEGAIRLLRVYERRTKSGKTYFLGAFGRSRVLIKRADNAKVNADSIAAWDVFIKERDPAADKSPRPQVHPQSDSATDIRPDQRQSRPARPKARPATAAVDKAPSKGVADVLKRFEHVSLNDDVPEM